MIKKYLGIILKFFGYRISKTRSAKYKSNYDFYYKTFITLKNPVIFDVGADKGVFINLFSKMFEDPTIHAFEPNEKTASDLFKIYKLNKNITINQIALGDEISDKKFHRSYVSGSSGFYKRSVNTRHYKRKIISNNINDNNLYSDSPIVNINTLDSYCEKNSIDHIDILKIDTEGYESKVLEGAKRMLQSNKIDVLQLELNHSSVYMDDHNVPISKSFYEIEKNLIPYNYRLVLLDGDRVQNLHENFNWQSELIYVASKVMIKNSKFFNEV